MWKTGKCVGSASLFFHMKNEKIRKFYTRVQETF